MRMRHPDQEYLLKFTEREAKEDARRAALPLAQRRELQREELADLARHDPDAYRNFMSQSRLQDDGIRRY